MAKLKIKKSGWLTYAVFITLMISMIYYTNNYRFGGGVDSFIPALIMWPVATLFAMFLYLNYYVGRDQLLDCSAVLSVIFLLSTLMIFSGNIIGLASDAVNNIIWWSLMMVFFHYTNQNGIEKKYISAAMLTIPVLAVVFLQLVNSFVTDSSIKTLNPIFYSLYLLPFALLNEKKTWQYCSIGIIFVTILISNKRTALIAFALVLVFYVIRNQREASRTVSRMFRNLLLVAVLFIGIYFIANFVLASYSMIDWRERLLSLGTSGGGGRIGRWLEFLEDTKNSSLFEWVFGHGFVYPHYHNDLLQVYYNCGIPGLLAYVTMCMLLILEYFKMARKKYKYTTAYGASLIIFFFNSTVGEVIIVHTWMLEMGAFWGLVFGDFRRAQRQEAERIMKEYD